ncbi:hypothetical protein PR202_gb22822 [Eleusine coracana subsp. coracana]|uniref:Signal peptidase complex catalytic subunit SEC11 n=1 Tax=Eleusine coracana subsp. coracana TaxID=191504 RepID=A0AAV5FHN1_ELECO|nr:hypothetical protein QOZ80_6BG0486010 [Eleusine coracana subsp. coracana]GJN34178.1 hypothetical protein PR202_gb22822 [Eleusine coracana subsp. coracana]
MDKSASHHRRGLTTRGALSEPVTLLVLLSTVLMALTAVEAATGARFAMRVIVSGSMEPALKRGDLVFFVKSDAGQTVREGDVILFKSEGFHIPIVHRVIKIHERRDGGDVNILTKGDNNDLDDAAFLYGRRPWLRRDEVLGKAVGYVPGAGWLSIGAQETRAFLQSWVREMIETAVMVISRKKSCC